MVIWKGVKTQYNSVVIRSCGWEESVDSKKYEGTFGNNETIERCVII